MNMNNATVHNLQSNEREIRLDAINIIGKSGNPDDVDPLLDHMERETDQSVKERIILALETLLPATGFKSVERMLRSHDAFIRNAGVEILKKQDNTILDRLLELSRDGDKDVRKLAIDAAIAYRGVKVVEIIKERFSDPDINIVCTAVEYLGNMKAENGVNEIGVLLITSDNPFLICTALEALANIGFTTHMEQIMDKFRDNSDPLLRYSFIKFMGRCADPNVFADYLDKALEGDGASYAREIIDAVEMIAERFPEAMSEKNLQESIVKLSKGINVGPLKYELSGLISRFFGDRMLRQAREDISANDLMTVLAAIEILGEYGSEEDMDLMENIIEKFADDVIEEAVSDAIGLIARRCDG